jgi:hypothetical protein
MQVVVRGDVRYPVGQSPQQARQKQQQDDDAGLEMAGLRKSRSGLPLGAISLNSMKPSAAITAIALSQ